MLVESEVANAGAGRKGILLMIGENMVIPNCGTFEYRGIVTADSFKPNEITFQVHDMGRFKEKRFAGLAPRLRVWNEQLILIPESSEFASMRLVEFPVGTVIDSVINKGDEVFVMRTGAGGYGLSIVRNSQLVLALGAVTFMPLGDNVRVNTIHESRGHQESIGPYVVGFDIQIENTRQLLSARDTVRIGHYHVYVERLGFGGGECVSIVCTENDKIINASMRAAILIACVGATHTEWNAADEKRSAWSFTFIPFARLFDLLKRRLYS